MKPWLSGLGRDIANCIGEWIKLRDEMVQITYHPQTHSYHLEVICRSPGHAPTVPPKAFLLDGRFLALPAVLSCAFRGPGDGSGVPSYGPRCWLFPHIHRLVGSLQPLPPSTLDTLLKTPLLDFQSTLSRTRTQQCFDPQGLQSMRAFPACLGARSTFPWLGIQLHHHCHSLVFLLMSFTVLQPWLGPTS